MGGFIMASIINASTSGAGGVITTADASGVLALQGGGTTVMSVASTGLSFAIATGVLLNTQYFTTAGTATYTPTTGTNFVIVEVVGGGGGSAKIPSYDGGTGGTSSFGVLVSATGGGVNTSPGAGASGDLNLTGQRGGLTRASTTVLQLNQLGGVAGLCYGTYGFGAYIDSSNSSTQAVTAGAGGGAARKKITSAFSGVTVTVGAGGTAGTSGNAGNSGIVIVYEYA
jgi:hypothetical protein